MNFNPSTNLSPGDELDGGIFLGVVGEPNDYGSIIAEGENPYCLFFGRTSYRCGPCDILPENTTERFILASGINHAHNVNGPCYCDSVMPWKYIPENKIQNPLNYEDIAHSPYFLNLHEMPIKRATASFGKYDTIQQYYKIAERYYGKRVITRKWALVVAPEDLKYNNTSDISWGLRQASYGATDVDAVENGLYYGSPMFDGLVGTRMFDKSSITWSPWFNPDGDGIDVHAYDRWVHSLENKWGDYVDKTTINTSETYFKEEFETIWENENKQNSAMRLISEWNENSNHGHDDWYIPSIIELMYIYGSKNAVNVGLIKNGFEPMSNARYWSSTSGSKYRADSPKNCVPQRNRFIPLSSHDYSLEDTGNLLSSHAHRAFYQDFSTGNIESQYRNEDFCSVRPVRRIPIFETTFECDFDNHIWRYIGVENGDCQNCYTCNCPELN